MDTIEARRRLDALIERNGGEGPHIVGVLIADETGAIGVSMDAGDEADILEMGILSSRKAGPVIVERELDRVTPVLEVVR